MALLGRLSSHTKFKNDKKKRIVRKNRTDNGKKRGETFDRGNQIYEKNEQQACFARRFGLRFTSTIILVSGTLACSNHWLHPDTRVLCVSWPAPTKLAGLSDSEAAHTAQAAKNKT